MNSKPKKELIPCDYCKTVTDANNIFTARKHFAGCKIHDILQSVTKLNVPATCAVKLCSMCAATLLAATNTIAKAEKMLATLSTVVKKPSTETVHEKSVAAANPESSPLKQPMANGASHTAAQQLVPIKALNDAKKQQPKPVEDNGPSTSQGIRANPRNQSRKTETAGAASAMVTSKKIVDLDADLEFDVKLTPAADGPKRNKDFINLFGASVHNVSDSEDEDVDDDVDVIDVGDVPKEMVKPNLPENFECKLCDFQSPYSKTIKMHLKTLHGQKRPRIYNCTKCTKSFGVLKSLKLHLATHGIVDKTDPKQQREKPKLAELIALRPKRLENTTIAEYSFDVNAKSSSTPKAPVECVVCHFQGLSVKALKAHMEKEHNTNKLFKCSKCDTDFMHKKSLDRHFKAKHGNPNEKATVKIKLPTRRITISDEKALEPSPKKVPERRKSMMIEKTEQPPTETSFVAETDEDNKDSGAKVEAEILPQEINYNKLPPRRQTRVFDGETFNLTSESLSPNKKVPIEATVEKSPAKSVKKSSPKKPLERREEPAEELAEEPAEQPAEQTAEKSPKKAAEHIADAFIDVSVEELTPDEPSNKHKTTPTPNTSIVNGTPKKSKKRKADKHLGASQDEDADECLWLSPAPPKSSKKKSKHDKQHKAVNDSESFDQFEEVNAHVKPHKRDRLDTSESDISCGQCGKSVGTLERLDSHNKRKHSKLKCPKCEMSYADSLQYISHFAACDASGGLPCGIQGCGKAFEAANYLSSHLKKKHKIK